MRHVLAPPGKLGLIFGTHDDGHAILRHIRAESPLAKEVGRRAARRVRGGARGGRARCARLHAVVPADALSARPSTLALALFVARADGTPGRGGVVACYRGGWRGVVLSHAAHARVLVAQLGIGDVVLALDGVDTSGLSHTELTLKLQEKEACERKLTVAPL